MYYDQRTELTGVIKTLAAKKLGASEEDTLEFAEYSWNSGYCETCSYTEYDFQVLKNNEVVYDSQTGSFRYGSSVFASFQDWLSDDEE